MRILPGVKRWPPALLAGGFIAVLALAGCASLSESQCRSGDWEAIGRADGTRGAAADQFERHREACARHGVEPQAEAWRQGYAKGLETYCTPAGGYVAGRSATGTRDACTGKAQASAFLEAHRHGQEVHALLRQVQDLARRVQQIDQEVLSGGYSQYEIDRMRLRATELSDTLRRRLWELQKLDQGFSLDYKAPELTDDELPSSSG